MFEHWIDFFQFDERCFDKDVTRFLFLNLIHRSKTCCFSSILCVIIDTFVSLYFNVLNLNTPILRRFELNFFTWLVLNALHIILHLS